jgi:predicted flavoprotein YhiN
VHGVQFSARKPGGKGKPATAQRGSLLFSHRGVTGPAVLDLSHHAVMALERRTPMPGTVRCLRT